MSETITSENPKLTSLDKVRALSSGGLSLVALSALTNLLADYKPNTSLTEYAARYGSALLGLIILGATSEMEEQANKPENKYASLKDLFSRKAAIYAFQGASIAMMGIGLSSYAHIKISEKARVATLPAIAPETIISESVADKVCKLKTGNTVPVTLNGTEYQVTCPVPKLQ